MPKRSTPLPLVAPDPEIDIEHRLETLVDHCMAAQAIAEARGDRFLSYMLAMTIQAAKNAQRGS